MTKIKGVSANQLLDQGVVDPRTLPGAIPHQLDDVSPEESSALIALNFVPDEFQTLRLPVQGVQLFQASPGVDGLNVMAMLPKILKQQRAMLVLTPEQEAKEFQEAIGLVEIRLVLRKEALIGDKDDE